jgi:hypothetical protein
VARSKEGTTITRRDVGNVLVAEEIRFAPKAGRDRMLLNKGAPMTTTTAAAVQKLLEISPPTIRSPMAGVQGRARALPVVVSNAEGPR